MTHGVSIFLSGALRTLAMVAATVAAGCVATPDRPARSTLGCAETAIDRDLPEGLPDKLAHCIAGALIARFCSPTEARLAGVVKELRDAFEGGDVELADIEATFAGVRCAYDAAGTDAMEACCRTRHLPGLQAPQDHGS